MSFPSSRGIEGRTLMEYAEDNPVLMNDARVLRELQEAMNGTRESAQRPQEKG